MLRSLSLATASQKATRRPINPLRRLVQRICYNFDRSSFAASRHRLFIEPIHMRLVWRQKGFRDGT
jgi:hypothetical protein